MQDNYSYNNNNSYSDSSYGNSYSTYPTDDKPYECRTGPLEGFFTSSVEFCKHVKFDNNDRKIIEIIITGTTRSTRSSRSTRPTRNSRSTRSNRSIGIGLPGPQGLPGLPGANSTVPGPQGLPGQQEQIAQCQAHKVYQVQQEQIAQCQAHKVHKVRGANSTVQWPQWSFRCTSSSRS